MNRTDLFRRLGAPLRNPQWSWGAVRGDGLVFLCVWQDEEQKHDGAFYMRLTNQVASSESASPGYGERLAHIELVRQGSPCYLVMLCAADPKATPRVIRSVNRNGVFVGGRLLEVDGDSWIERRMRVSIDSLAHSRGD